MTTEKAVFISHSSRDRKIAERVCGTLEEAGISCWIAPRDISAGEEYGAAIMRAIASVEAVLVILSAAANNSNQLQLEVERAVSHRRRIVPVRVEDVAPVGALELFLSASHWLDLFGGQRDAQLDTLRAHVQKTLAMSEAVAPSPNRPRRAAVAAAWLGVAVLAALVGAVEWKWWFNLVSWPALPLFLAQRPMLLALPIAAGALPIVFCATAGCSARRALRLEPLIIAGGRPNLPAIVAWAAAVAALAITLTVIPPALRIDLVPTPLEDPQDGFTEVFKSVNQGYVLQSASHYRISIRSGAYNPHVPFELRLTLRPYGTREGLEFARVHVDRRLGARTQDLHFEDMSEAAFFEFACSDPPAGAATILFSTTYYSGNSPGNRARAEIRLVAGPYSANLVVASLNPGSWPQ